eukprot:gene10721-7452_t
MGGCVLSRMDSSHEKSLVPDKQIRSFRNYGPNSLPVSGTETATSTAIYRNAQHHSDEARNKFFRQALSQLQPSRMYEVCQTKSSKTAFQYRKVLKVQQEESVVGGEKKMMEVSYMSDPISMTYKELWGTVESLAKGLKEIGVAPRSNVCIYEDTRWEWLATVYAIWGLDGVTSTVYANLGEDALCYALRETECSAIICNGKHVPLLLRNAAAGRFPACRIVYLDELPAGTDCSDTNGCTVVSWLDVVEKGSKSQATLQLPTDAESLALIMYTSGTTGDPKGVMHSHGSLTVGVQTLNNWMFDNYGQLPDDLYISYLPLAHILAFGVVNIFLANNTMVCFGSPRTLTDATARPKGDLATFRPTMIIGVPRIYDTVRRGIEAKLPPPGSLKRRVFDQAYQSRLKALKDGNDTPYYNEKVFKMARAAMGGRLRLILTGGGPISAATQEFMNVVIGKIVCGWGLTETVCVGGVQRFGDVDIGYCGQVLIGEELKLVDTQDYKHTDTPEPRGELCIRGPFLFKGYYKQPELTKEAIDEDGWFHTGDVGSVSADGRISVIGRIKALAKNCLGEYIALETLESIYAGHPLVLNNCICVIVHPDRNYIGAVLVTDDAKLSAFIAQHHIQVTASDPAKDKAVHRKVVEKFVEMAKEAKRQPFEFIKKVIIVRGEWTPENDVLTAATKLKRRVIDVKYAEEIKELFEEE